MIGTARRQLKVEIDSELGISKDSTKLLTGGSFDIRVILRVLSVLRNDGRTKRTNLAGKTGLNYKQCIRYVNLLLLLDWASIVLDDGNWVTITNKGTEIIERVGTIH